MKYLIKLVFSIFLCLPQAISYSQNLVINEVMSSNSSTITDEDGDYSDWIELYNNSGADVNLAGYTISDNLQNNEGWVFPSITLPPDSFMLIFASGKNRGFLVNHWETVIDKGDIWSYHYVDVNLPKNWFAADFDETGWQTGPSGFGYGDGDDATEIPQMLSFYIRKRFNIADVSQVLTAFLDIDYDDAFVAYLNGVEIARDNIGTVGIPPPYDAKANLAKEAKMYLGGAPDRFLVENAAELLHTGENVLAIQVHNVNITSSDLTLIPFFSLGMTQPPADARGPSSYLQFESSILHVNFKIDAQGEVLTLTNPLEEVVDQILTGQIPTDISRGRKPDGNNLWYYFSEPSPGSTNIGEGYIGISSGPQFSHLGGFYQDQIFLEISTQPSGGDIYFTTDGSVPTMEHASSYLEPINIANGVRVIRAMAVQQGYLPSEVVTHTYFINQNFQLPVISLSTDPANFFDDEIGIYVKGNEANADFPYWGANFWSDCPHSDMRGYGCENWERPVHLEFFESDGNLGFSVDAGARIHGHWMRGLPQKSIAIIARNDYGYPEINYKIFPDRSLDTFKAILLRQSGNDWSSTMFRDGLAYVLGKQRDLDVMAFRPSILFINGQYWGVHNIREKINEHYVQSHYNIQLENLDLIENQYGTWPMYGTLDEYNQMISFLNNNDLSINENYEIAAEWIDIDEFINYVIIELYANNSDWLGGNCKRWFVPGRKWRWILNDLDAGFNQYPGQMRPPEEDIFSNQNLPGFTEYQALIKNEQFRDRFINSFADHLNTIFIPEYFKHVVDSLKAIIEPEMPAHIQRWANTFVPGVWWIGDGINSMQEWYTEIDRLYDYADIRESNAWNFIRFEFNLEGFYNIEINSKNGEGSVQLNTISIENFPWQGKYFKNIPITLTAHPKSNYMFSKWISGTDTSYQNPLILQPNASLSVQVVFKDLEQSELLNQIVINEINYNSADNFNTEDWVEIYNNSDSLVDLSGWIFKDSDDAHVFIFPNNVLLAPENFLVLCRDTTAFLTFFSQVNNFYGNMNFGLDGAGELIRLFDPQGRIVDSLTYDDEPPWPTDPDGNGPTLVLRNPAYDNSKGENWTASMDHGTPGYQNVTSIGEGEVVEVFYIKQNYPNPFNQSTILEYNLPFNTRVEIKIFNVRGQVVKTFINANQAAGLHKFEWNGKSNKGMDSPSGIYFFQIHISSNNTKTIKNIKMLLIR